MRTATLRIGVLRCLESRYPVATIILSLNLVHATAIETICRCTTARPFPPCDSWRRVDDSSFLGGLRHEGAMPKARRQIRNILSLHSSMVDQRRRRKFVLASIFRPTMKRSCETTPIVHPLLDLFQQARVSGKPFRGRAPYSSRD